MPTTNGHASFRQRLAIVRDRVTVVRERAEQTHLWQVWDRMLEIEFVDRSVALAGKAFVSFFPLVIVVASFMPKGIQHAIFTTLTHRLGIEGNALGDREEGLRFLRQHPPGDRDSRPGPHRLLREFVHDRAPKGVPTGLAAPARQKGR